METKMLIFRACKSSKTFLIMENKRLFCRFLFAECFFVTTQPSQIT